MAVSPHTQVLQTNPKSEEGDSETIDNSSRQTDSNSNNNNEECKDTLGATPPTTDEEENNNLNINGEVSTANAILDVQSNHVNSTPLLNAVIPFINAFPILS